MLFPHASSEAQRSDSLSSNVLKLDAWEGAVIDLRWYLSNKLDRGNMHVP